MSHPFKPGDRVVIVKSANPRMIGVVATVASGLVQVDAWLHDGVNIGGGLMHQLTDATHREPLRIKTRYDLVYPPSHLEPYRPDHNERVEWTPELVKLCRKGRVGA